MILMDDREGVALARRNGIGVTGTLGVLSMAAKQHLVNLAEPLQLPALRERGPGYRA